MRTKKFITFTIFLLTAFTYIFPQEEVYLRITEGMPVIPVAIPKFTVHENSPKTTAAAETLHEVISADLKYTRIFTLLPKTYYSYIRPLNPGKIFFKDWESIQAHLLFVGEVYESEGDNIIFEGKLYDVKASRLITGKRYEGDKSLLRLIAHKMSDKIMEAYGEKPIFTSKIVFISNRDGNDEIYMMDYDGHNQTRLTFNKVKDYMPAWDPDGKWIAYTSYQNINAGLYKFNPWEGKRIKIFDGGTSFSPAFSPDGKKLAFCSTQEEGNSEIYVGTSEGKNIKRLTFNKAIDTAPTWSPTSREIAFTSDRGGTPQIYVMDAEGANVRRASFAGSYHDAPVWSPAGDMIAYVSRVDLVFDIYILNRRTNEITKLTESYARNESPCWSPDGRHIIFSSNRTGTLQLYTIDYDAKNLRRLTSRGDNKLPDWTR
jgi:TolB protein